MIKLCGFTWWSMAGQRRLQCTQLEGHGPGTNHVHGWEIIPVGQEDDADMGAWL